MYTKIYSFKKRWNKSVAAKILGHFVINSVENIALYKKRT